MPDQATVNDGLRALTYVGTKDELQIIDSFANNAANGQDLREVATRAAKSIRARKE
jgi:hypothetical protein